MSVRLKLSDLRKIISEEIKSKRHLLEAKEEKEDGEDSIDGQLDKYFAEYESEAKNSKNEGLDFRSFVRRFLTEADEEEEEPADEEPTEEPADEEPADEEPEEPEKLTIEDIDIGSFVADVMRLVDNYDSLLEMRNTILRRATNFLFKNYEKNVAESFKEDLLESYGIEIGKSKSEMDDEYQAPKAGAAGPAGGSAG